MFCSAGQIRWPLNKTIANRDVDPQYRDSFRWWTERICPPVSRQACVFYSTKNMLLVRIWSQECYSPLAGHGQWSIMEIWGMLPISSICGNVWNGPKCFFYFILTFSLYMYICMEWIMHGRVWQCYNYFLDNPFRKMFIKGGYVTVYMWVTRKRPREFKGITTVVGVAQVDWMKILLVHSEHSLWEIVNTYVELRICVSLPHQWTCVWTRRY